MQCEIIPDMFGKSCRLMTPAGKRSGRTDRTAAVRRVTQAFMWPCDWIFLLNTPPPHNVCHGVAFLLEEASRGGEQTEAHSEMFFLLLRTCRLRDKTEGFARRPVGAVSPTFT